MARGYSMDDIQEALLGDENFAMANYINDNANSITGGSQDAPEYGLAPFTAQANLKETGYMDLAKRVGPRLGLAVGLTSKKDNFITKFLQGKSDKASDLKKLSKWGFKLTGDGKNAGIMGKQGKTKTLVGRFLRGVQSIGGKKLGPKLARKLALKFASAPVKAAIPVLGWAWLAYDVMDMVGGDENLFKQIKALWGAETQQFNTKF